MAEPAKDDELEGVITEQNVKAQIESWLKGLRTVLIGIAEIEVTRAKMIKAFDDEHATQLEELKEARDVFTRQISDAFMAHLRFLLPGKLQTAKFPPNGTVALRTATESLVIPDEAAAERWLRRKGLWRRFSTKPKPKPSISLLKKAEDVIAMAPDSVMHLVRKSRVIIDVPAVQLKDQREPYPLHNEVELPGS